MSNKISYQQIRQRSIKSELIYIGILVIALGLIILHTVTWNNNGMHAEMLSWVGAGVYLMIIYNLALMLVSGALLGILLGKISGLFKPIGNKNK